ncbi:MAG TPA: hypothetical protein VFQ54_07700, partial [Thermomicrobiales bacterium]|nr:hypothetical protein [Thermomicrobiales bacterium]
MADESVPLSPSGKTPRDDDDAQPTESLDIDPPRPQTNADTLRSFFARAASGDTTPSSEPSSSNAEPDVDDPAHDGADTAAIPHVEEDGRAATWMSSFKSDACSASTESQAGDSEDATIVTPAPTEPTPERIASESATAAGAGPAAPVNGPVPPAAEEIPPPGDASTGAKANARASGDAAPRPGSRMPRFQLPKLGNLDSIWNRLTLDPVRAIVPTVPHQITLAVGAVLALLSLLANSGGLALIIAGGIVPILVLLTLN